MAAVTSRSTEPGGRRSRRPWRQGLALLLTATCVAASLLAALVAGTLALGLALGAVAAAAAVAASVLLLAESRQLRLDWAQDRAGLAHAARRDATCAARDHVRFADAMAAKVRERQRLVEKLGAQVEAERAARVEVQRDLTARLEHAHAELRDLQERVVRSEDAAFEAEARLLVAEPAQGRRRRLV